MPNDEKMGEVQSVMSYTQHIAKPGETHPLWGALLYLAAEIDQLKESNQC